MVEELQAIRRNLSQGRETEIDHLRRLDWRKRLGELAFFVGCWLGGLALITSAHRMASLNYWAGVALSVIALNAFVLLLHEGMHAVLFKNRALNDVVSVLTGSTVGISYTAYKIMHLRHHQYLGDERDPDDYNNYTGSRRVVWMLHGMRVAVGSLLYLFMIPFYARRYARGAERSRLLAEYAWIAAVAIAIASKCTLSGWAWHHGVPLLIVGWMVNLRGFTQHGLAVAEDPYLASRSVHAKPWLRFLLLNENYHLEHHLFPEVPSYNLHQLHLLLWPQLPRATKNDSYGEFLWASLKAAPHLDETPIGIVVKSKEKPS